MPLSAMAKQIIALMVALAFSVASATATETEGLKRLHIAAPAVRRAIARNLKWHRAENHVWGDSLWDEPKTKKQ
jgi:hypothetical protein